VGQGEGVRVFLKFTQSREARFPVQGFSLSRPDDWNAIVALKFWLINGLLSGCRRIGRFSAARQGMKQNEDIPGAICAYKLGALGDRSAELKPEKER
jgi:hypothetical protein